MPKVSATIDQSDFKTRLKAQTIEVDGVDGLIKEVVKFLAELILNKKQLKDELHVIRNFRMGNKIISAIRVFQPLESDIKVTSKTTAEALGQIGTALTELAQLGQQFSTSVYLEGKLIFIINWVFKFAEEDD
jgi:hypothetical protein